MKSYDFPRQLMNPDYRFFPVWKNSKKPVEKKWNSANCYPFFHSKILSHLDNGGNIGVVTGIAGLIVIDFDSRAYWNKVHNQLPWTFCVRTAGSGLYHLYYILNGDEMIRKIGIDDEAGNRLCDIQADRCGIICPPSRIDRKHYQVYTDAEITHIDSSDLKAIFAVVPKKRCTDRFSGIKATGADLNASIAVLEAHGIERTGQRAFRCPFHPSRSGRTLWLFDTNTLFCFHCRRRYDTVTEFITEYKKWRTK